MTDRLNAVVTGGASGMGREIARRIIDRGGRVLIADMDEAALEEAHKSLGRQALSLKADVSREHEVKAMLAMAVEAFGEIDLVFANAGLQFDAAAIEATSDEFDLQIGTNLKGSWMTAKAFARHWLDNGKPGRICFTGSEHSLGFQHDGAAIYTASKHAILGLADVMRRELPERIGISVFCPGLVNTGFYASREKAGLEASEAELETGEKLMAHGMPAEQAARGAVEGTLAGEFIIVTHAVAREGAKQRWDDIDDAFQRQAPPGSDAANYKVTELKKKIGAD